MILRNDTAIPDRVLLSVLRVSARFAGADLEGIRTVYIRRSRTRHLHGHVEQYGRVIVLWDVPMDRSGWKSARRRARAAIRLARRFVRVVVHEMKHVADYQYNRRLRCAGRTDGLLPFAIARNHRLGPWKNRPEERRALSYEREVRRVRLWRRCPAAYRALVRWYLDG